MIDRIIKKRLHRMNRNYLGVITGETGSGKSWSALRICENVDPEFDASRCIFTPKEFLSILNSGELHKGSMLLMDEAGVSLPAREWQSFSNRAIGYILQTFRHENIGVIFTVPNWGFIDSQARNLMHGYAETVGIDYERSMVRLKYFNLQFSSRFGKLYFKRPRVRKDNSWAIVDRMNIPMPSEKLIEDYEAKKVEFTSQLKQDMEVGIDNVERAKEEKEAKRPIDIDACLDVVCDNPAKFRGSDKRFGDYLDHDLIRAQLNCSERTSAAIKKLAEKRLGWA